MEWKRADELEAGKDSVAWTDSDTGPAMLAELIASQDVGRGGFLSGRWLLAVRLEDGSVRRATMSASQPVLALERPKPKRAAAAEAS